MGLNGRVSGTASEVSAIRRRRFLYVSVAARLYADVVLTLSGKPLDISAKRNFTVVVT